MTRSSCSPCCTGVSCPCSRWRGGGAAGSPAVPRQSLPAGAAPAVVASHILQRSQNSLCTQRSENTLYRVQQTLASYSTNCKCCTSSGGGNLTFYCTKVREYIVYTKVREYTVQSPAGPRQSLPAGAAPAVVAFMVALHILQRSENTLYRDQKILPSNIKHGSGNWKS